MGTTIYNLHDTFTDMAHHYYPKPIYTRMKANLDILAAAS